LPDRGLFALAEYKDRKDNPLHREFGLWNNAVYILKKCMRYCPSVLVIALVGLVCESILTYYWGIIGKYVIDVIQTDKEIEESIRQILFIVLAGGAAAGLIQFGSTYSRNKTWYRYIYVRMQLITERVDRALRINYQMLERPDVLDVHQRATSATNSNNNGVEGMMHIMYSLGINLVTLAVTAVSVTVLDWRLIFILFGLAVVQYIYHKKCIRTDKEEVWDKLATTWRQVYYMERVTQDFDYAKEIRLYHLSDYLMGKQQQIYEKRWEKLDCHYGLWFRHGIILHLVFMTSRGFIYAALFFAIFKKGMSIGSFTLYLALAMAFSRSMIEFLHKFGDFQRASLEVDDFRSFMELDLEDKEETVELPETSEYTIEFHNVSYRYLEAEKDALKNLNLTIRPGEKLAVVGLNGAGKTTMIKLLLRLYDPTEGYITLNGIDIRRFDREKYYKLFAPVFQDVEVLAFPIAQNISMKAKEKTDADRAYSCAVEAGLKERIDSLPNGVMTEVLKVVDEDGVDFSGGEKQKLALARALYKGARIVVLDEPTSALDAIAEQRLYESFDSMIGNKSAVYISHRLASTRFCDKIAMFKDGEMIEYGSHDELMKMRGEYAHMFEIQAQYYQRQEGEAQ